MGGACGVQTLGRSCVAAAHQLCAEHPALAPRALQVSSQAAGAVAQVGLGSERMGRREEDLERGILIVKGSPGAKRGMLRHWVLAQVRRCLRVWGARDTAPHSWADLVGGEYAWPGVGGVATTHERQRHVVDGLWPDTNAVTHEIASNPHCDTCASPTAALRLSYGCRARLTGWKYVCSASIMSRTSYRSAASTSTCVCVPNTHIHTRRVCAMVPAVSSQPYPAVPQPLAHLQPALQRGQERQLPRIKARRRHVCRGSTEWRGAEDGVVCGGWCLVCRCAASTVLRALCCERCAATCCCRSMYVHRTGQPPSVCPSPARPPPSRMRSASCG
jgi:hypothetical protein